MGDPCLLKVAAPVAQFGTPELKVLVEDLEDTMKAMDGAGIAAPQIGVSQQIVIFGSNSTEENPRYSDASSVPYTVLINPSIRPLNDVMLDGWEGCLSVPGMRGLVPRYEAIHYTGYDLHGELIDRTASGFHARVVQHECDHLNGVLYPMRINDLKDFGYIDAIFPEQSVPAG